MKKWYFIVGLTLVLLISSLSGCSSKESSPQLINVGSQQEGISVSGTGKVSIVPDIAILTLGIQSQETTVAAAQTKANEAMDNLLKSLSDGGIASSDIQTNYFNIQAVTKYDNNLQQSQITGYMVTNTVTARIKKIETSSTVINAAVATGGDLIRINGISFTVADPTPFYNQAREKAMADSLGKADQLAKLAGITRGKPVLISESGSFPVPQPVQVSLSAAASTSISPGTLELSVNVQVVYSIQN